MIIARLKGGLGNQMFLYAIGRHLSIKNNTQLKLDTTYLKLINKKNLKLSGQRNYELKYFNISAKEIPVPFGMTILPRIFYKILRVLFRGRNLEHLYPLQKDYYFDKSIFKKKVFVIDDYWQSENYFKDISDVIKKDFTLKYKLNEKNKLMLEKITNANSIGLHIRRGDVASEGKRAKETGRPFSLDYYHNTIKLITKKVKNPHFFIFSDDPKWTKENLKIKFPTTYVDINNQDEGYKDLDLMKHCKHFIIASSTFSWWAAWLSENKNKIIFAPKRWFNPLEEGEVPKNTKIKWRFIRDEGDIIPKGWIRVEG